ncbi:MAG TPA: 30S ribosomal protein S4, partial [Balneolaceae bacterium]|nr:30S ribosomal protein S4 [Balneolaceae bacterium]
GEHGQSRFNRKSEYAIQLEEKQKAKYTYGLLEKQFHNLFKKANAKEGVTGEIFLQFLESRLDNTVYRLGIARTRRQGRQFVNHNHIVVNGEIVNVPSYQLKAGDVISVRPKSKNLQAIEESLEYAPSKKYNWLEIDKQTKKGKFLHYPDVESVPENINLQLIVELYSK